MARCNQTPPARNPSVLYGPVSACSQNCNQGRACTCAPESVKIPPGSRFEAFGAPVVIPTRPSLLARLRRWWKLRPLREELAGLDAEHAAVFEEVSTLLAQQFMPGDDTAARMNQANLAMARLELLDITQRRSALLAKIDAAELRA